MIVYTINAIRLNDKILASYPIFEIICFIKLKFNKITLGTFNIIKYIKNKCYSVFVLFNKYFLTRNVLLCTCTFSIIPTLLYLDFIDVDYLNKVAPEIKDYYIIIEEGMIKISSMYSEILSNYISLDKLAFITTYDYSLVDFEAVFCNHTLIEVMLNDIICLADIDPSLIDPRILNDPSNFGQNSSGNNFANSGGSGPSGSGSGSSAPSGSGSGSGSGSSSGSGSGSGSNNPTSSGSGSGSGSSNPDRSSGSNNPNSSSNANNPSSSNSSSSQNNPSNSSSSGPSNTTSNNPSTVSNDDMPDVPDKANRTKRKILEDILRQPKKCIDKNSEFDVLSEEIKSRIEYWKLQGEARRLYYEGWIRRLEALKGSNMEMIDYREKFAECFGSEQHKNLKEAQENAKKYVEMLGEFRKYRTRGSNYFTNYYNVDRIYMPTYTNLNKYFDTIKEEITRNGRW